MRLEAFTVADFRNYSALELEPRQGLNVFVGANAQGKSNLLEAIAVLGIGKSFRGARDAEMIREGSERATVRGRAATSRGNAIVACSIARLERGTRKTFSLGTRSVPYGRFVGTLKVVTFVPSDLQLALGTPGLRRSFLNVGLVQQDAGYYRELSRYQAAQRQKNALLRSGGSDDELLAVYNRELAESGARLSVARRRFVERLHREAQRVHAQWSHGELLEVRYVPNVPFEGEAEERAREAIERRFEEVAQTERLRGVALAGPHRDDLSLLLDGRRLAAFGSQGQQRTAVLALKIAEYEVMRETCGEAPLLLLDDVLSELDERRAAAFLDGVGDYEQAYVTATHRPSGLPQPAALFSVDAARVSPLGA